MEYIVLLLSQFLAVMIVISFHEFAHAYVAYKCGDPTAKMLGRMTLNPLKHFDPLGILMFALVGFGWANPVPINPYNFHHYRKGSFWTSAAGVITNYLMAFLAFPIFILVIQFVCPLSVIAGTYAEAFLYRFFYCLFAYSLSFCVFNLLPFYPLDGFRIIDALDKKHGKFYQFLRTYGHYILIGLIALSFIADYLPFLGYIDILGYVMDFSIGVLGKPITTFWNWIFRLIF